MRDRLYRSRTDRVLFGVAGGFAEWLDLDPALVRIVWALLVLAGGTGLLLYIIAAIVIPEEPWELATPAGAPMAPAEPAVGPDGAPIPAAPEGTTPTGTPVPPAYVTPEQARQARRAARQAARGQRDGTGILVFGVILVIVGGWFLLRDFIPGLDDRIVGPGLLIVIGVLLVGGAMLRQGSERPH